MATPTSARLPPRRFTCGWGVRPDKPLRIALFIRAINRQMAAAEPEWRDLWPLFAARAIRPGRDPGPVLELCAEDLADLIDRKGRFDPPPFPAPVSSDGYSLTMTVNRTGLDPLDVGLSVRAGIAHRSPIGNNVLVEPQPTHPIWRDAARGWDLLEAMIEATNADWACAAETIVGEIVPNESVPARILPWMAWTAAGKEIPVRYTADAGSPTEVLAVMGGELRMWA